MQEQSKFVRHKLPCPSCGGSDPVSMNEDKSAHCFSCETHFPNYVDACDGKIVDTTPKPKVTTSFLNSLFATTAITLNLFSFKYSTLRIF